MEIPAEMFDSVLPAVMQRRRRRKKRKRPGDPDADGTVGGGVNDDAIIDDPGPPGELDLVLIFQTATGGELECLNDLVVPLSQTSEFLWDSAVIGTPPDTMQFAVVVAPEDPGVGDPTDHLLTMTIEGTGGAPCAFVQTTTNQFFGSGTVDPVNLSFTVEGDSNTIVGVVTEV